MARPLFFAALLFAALLPGAAFGDDATSLKAEGDRLMDSLRYEDALSKYDAAYKLKADPALLYNQGRALEGLGRFPDALDKLLAFQEKAPKELLARLGDALPKNITELRGRIATITVTIDPPGASVRLGDRILGEAPLEKLRVNAGKAHFELSKEGYFPETVDVTLIGNQDNPVKLSLTPRDARATVSITSPVAGAKVTIDGAARGQVPLEVKLSPGPHLVQVEQSGYQDFESTIELQPQEKKKLEVALFDTPVTQQWWLWTSIGVALTGGGVAAGLMLTQERPADEGSLSPGKLAVGSTEPTRILGRAALVPSRSVSNHGPAVQGFFFLAPPISF